MGGWIVRLCSAGVSYSRLDTNLQYPMEDEGSVSSRVVFATPGRPLGGMVALLSPEVPLPWRFSPRRVAQRFLFMQGVGR